MRLDLRVCFIGDSFTAGAGDETALGWVGRVATAAWGRGVALTAYNLGVRRETSADMLRRAEAEVLARLAGGDRQAVVFCFGANDTTFENGAPRVPPGATLEHARSLLGWASPRWPTLLLGQPPLAHDAAQDARAAALCPQLAAVARALGVPYLALHVTLSADPRWGAAAARGDGVHPDSDGYAALAALVEAWPAWRALTGG